MVVHDIDGVVKVAPVPSDDPPVDAAYQLMVPAEAVAPKPTVPVPHLDAGVVPVIVGMAFIVAVICSSRSSGTSVVGSINIINGCA